MEYIERELAKIRSIVLPMLSAITTFANVCYNSLVKMLNEHPRSYQSLFFRLKQIYEIWSNYFSRHLERCGLLLRSKRSSKARN